MMMLIAILCFSQAATILALVLLARHLRKEVGVFLYIFNVLQDGLNRNSNTLCDAICADRNRISAIETISACQDGAKQNG